ncbi:MAG: Uma2 family endonuclease [Acidobacteria bacterium]|nr:Uma2 family endonuclease [Acidobacteriota bacterium]
MDESMEKASKSVGLTYEDLCRMPDDGMRHELIDGELYVSPAPRLKHQRVSGNLFAQLFWYLREHPLGRAYYAPLDIVFSDTNVVEPDILYISREREERQATERYLAGAPDLVVEILSPSTRYVDLGVKLRLYERFGVPEYWVIDTENETVKIYQLEERRLLLRSKLSRGDGTSVIAISTSLLPGFHVSLDEIFA